MRRSVAILALAGLLALGACGDPDESTGGVSAEESDQLNEAAAMLDEGPDALPPIEEVGEEGDAEAGELPVKDGAATEQ